MGQTNEFQRNFADLQKKYDPKRQQLKALSDEVDNLTKQSADPGRQAERRRASQPGQDHRRQEEAAAARRRGCAPTTSRGDAGDVQRPGFEGVRRAASYAQQHGYTLVLDVAQQQTPVLYALTPPTSPSRSSTPTTSSRAFRLLRPSLPARPPPARGSQARRSQNAAREPLKAAAGSVKSRQTGLATSSRPLRLQPGFIDPSPTFRLESAKS